MEHLKRKNISMKMMFCGGIIFGIIVFLCIYGFRIVDVTYDEWLWNGEDLSQHYSGWLSYRSSAWRFPLGLCDTLIDGQLISVMYTDSIPWLAVIFKALSAILPSTFQYLGLYGLMCFALQGGFAFLIMYKLTDNAIYSVVSGSILFFTAPLFQRMFTHTALASNWIILASFTLWIFHKDFRSIKTSTILWCGIFALSVGIHMYYLPMVGALMFFRYLQDAIENKKYWSRLACVISAVLSAVLALYVLGGFYGGAQFDQSGLGSYSMNWNSLFNSSNIGRILPALPLAQADQYEGIAYLGLGGILALVIGLAALIVNYIKNHNGICSNRIGALCGTLCAFALLVFAASPKVTFGSHVLFTIPLPDIIIKVWNVFRSSGRAAWPVMYAIIIIGMVLIWKNFKQFVAILLSAACLCIQIYDFSAYIGRKHMEFFSPTAQSVQLTPTDVWTSLLSDVSNIQFMSDASAPLVVSYNSKTVYALVRYAMDNDVNLSNFHIGRKSTDSINEKRNSAFNDIFNGNSSDDTIYVFDKMYLDKRIFDNLNIYQMDDMFIGVTKPIDKSLTSKVKEVEYGELYSFSSKLPNAIGAKYENNALVVSSGETASLQSIWLGNGKYKITVKGEALKSSTLKATDESINIVVDSIADKEMIFIIEIDKEGEDVTLQLQTTEANCIISDITVSSAVKEYESLAA